MIRSARTGRAFPRRAIAAARNSRPACGTRSRVRVLTVRGEMESRVPISRRERPAARHRSTANSAGLGSSTKDTPPNEQAARNPSTYLGITNATPTRGPGRRPDESPPSAQSPLGDRLSDQFLCRVRWHVSGGFVMRARTVVRRDRARLHAIAASIRLARSPVRPAAARQCLPARGHMLGPGSARRAPTAGGVVTEIEVGCVTGS